MAEGGGTPLLCPLLGGPLGVVIIVVAVVMISKEAVDCERAMVVDVIENNAINSLSLDFFGAEPAGCFGPRPRTAKFDLLLSPPSFLRQTETHISRSSMNYDDEGLHGSSIRQVRASFCSTCFFEVVAIDGV